jgi:hypothetical protein
VLPGILFGALSLFRQEFAGLVFALLDGERVELGSLVRVAILCWDVDTYTRAVTQLDTCTVVDGPVDATVPFHTA